LTLPLPLEAGGTPKRKGEPKLVNGGLCCCPCTTGTANATGERIVGLTLSKHEKEG